MKQKAPQGGPQIDNAAKRNMGNGNAPGSLGDQMTVRSGAMWLWAKKTI